MIFKIKKVKLFSNNSLLLFKRIASFKLECKQKILVQAWFCELHIYKISK